MPAKPLQRAELQAYPATLLYEIKIIATIKMNSICEFRIKILVWLKFYCPPELVSEPALNLFQGSFQRGVTTSDRSRTALVSSVREAHLDSRLPG
jgi:hypothetical protein